MTLATPTTLTVFCAVAIESEMDELLPRFARQSGIPAEVKYDVNPAVARRVVEGEVFDVGLTNPWYFDEMVSKGGILPDIHVAFGRVPLTLGGAGDAPLAPATSLDAVRDLLLHAETIAYTSTGTSGKTFLKSLEMIGIRDTIQDRLRPMGAGEPTIAAARGDVQYAISPLARIIAAPGIDPVGIFPSELGLDIDISMFVHGHGDLDRASQLIAFLSDPELDTYLREHGVYRFQLGSSNAARKTW
jgi:molybdate transport system substrate-binding protein